MKSFMPKFLIASLLIASSSLYARQCQDSDSVSSIRSLNIKLTKELELKQNIDPEYVVAYFSKGEMTTKYLKSMYQVTHKRQISVKFDSSYIKNDTLKPFECNVTAYSRKRWYDSDLNFYNCPLEGMTINRSLLDLRSDTSISFKSLKYNLGDHFKLKGECSLK